MTRLGPPEAPGVFVSNGAPALTTAAVATKPADFKKFLRLTDGAHFGTHILFFHLHSNGLFVCGLFVSRRLPNLVEPPASGTGI